jgi:nitroimidazol reductase NimA-like FMN-containing flavoprotein (pyridoxamine 5'-phosphate oxidase superfamily)
MTEYAPTPLTTLRRRPARAHYDRREIAAILDEAIYCHVSYHVDGQTFCIPLIHARVGDALYIHGSSGNRTLRDLRDGASACVNVSLLDGLVLGRSAFRTSVNYRSVVIFATAEEVTDPAEKLAALRAIVESAVPGRWRDVRKPTEAELSLVLVLRLPLAEVSAKVRTGPPADDEADYARPCWAGVIPLAQSADEPVDDPRLAPGLRAPAYAVAYARPGASGGKGGAA